MKRILLAYSSQGGSTRKAAEAIRDGLAEGGCEVRMLDVRDGPPSPSDRFDCAGFGCPTYMFRPSFAMTDFIDSLDRLEGMPVFTFTTFGSEIGDGANGLRARLRDRGAAEIGHRSFPGRHRFPGYVDRGYVFSPAEPSAATLDGAREYGRLIASGSIPAGAEAAADPPAHWVSRLERALMSRFLIMAVYSRFFSSDRRRCRACGRCSEACPTRNVSLDDGGRPKWGRRCVLCCACAVACPARAVSTPLSWPVFAPFLAYNIRRTARSGVPCERPGS
jgi:flavodoxin/NAD-dependent dihydropyrimidine dehydrogenase PreA subunit